MAAGRISCDACGKSYSWKPEIAGRRVKCKCGSVINVPATDPAAAAAASSPDNFDDLMALGEGAPVGGGGGGGDYAPAVAVPVVAAGRGGSKCPSCGVNVDPSAVICVNCGQNLKTGKKLKTSKVSDSAGAAPAAGRAPEYRSFGVKNVAGESMSAEKKKILAIGLSLVLVLLIGGVITIIVMGLKNDKEHQARLNSKPAKLEKMIENMDEAGGIGAAMHDGTLLKGVDDPSRQSAEVQIANMKALAKINDRCDAMYNTKGPEAKAWLAGDPKAYIASHDHAQSIAFVDELAALGVKDIRVGYLPVDDGHGGTTTQGVVATLPTDKAARKKIFAWYDGLDNVIEANDQPHQEEYGQKAISIEFSGK